MSEVSKISYRLATPEEDSFFRRLFDITRGPEFEAAGLSKEELDEILTSQYFARKTHYHDVFPEAEYKLIFVDEVLVGGLIIRERDDDFHLIDITLLDEHRNKGIGAAVMQELQLTAKNAGKGMLLHVEHFNPAQNLYKRLGFVETEQIGLYWRMIWTP